MSGGHTSDVQARGRAGEPVRVLHVLSGLGRGGIEIWLLHVLRALDRNRYQMDFLIVAEEPGSNAAAYERLGSRIALASRRPWHFAREFVRVCERFGPYDAVHAHIHRYSGLVMRCAAGRGVPLRIVHSHSDTRLMEAGASRLRRLYLSAMDRWIRRYATHRLAVSRAAAEDLFGPGWQEDSGCAIHYCGLDFSAFAAPVDRVATRAAVGLAPDTLVLGHVARFFARKNHPFMLEVAAEVFRRAPHARLLLLGDGPEEPRIRARAQALGLEERVVFAGARDDIPAMMRGAIDVFVLPSHHEGLSLAVLEAQASGLPCVLSESQTAEGDVVHELVHRLPLAAGPQVWAERVLEVAVAAGRPMPTETCRILAASEFGLQRSIERLRRLYESAGALAWAAAGR